MMICFLVNTDMLHKVSSVNQVYNTDMKPKVSVIIPVYNTEAYLKRCLDSVINQTLKDIEVIALDDGSLDNSGKILDKYAQKDSRIRVVHQENSGVGGAYNAGLVLAQGEYVAFLDSDDWIDPTLYADYYIKAKETDADVVSAWGYYVEYKDKDTKFIRKIPKNKTEKLITAMQDIPEFIYHHVSIWNSMYKNSFLKQNHIDFPVGKLDFSFSDVAFIMKVYGNANSIYVVKNVYYHYSRTPASSLWKKQSSFSLGITALNNYTNAVRNLSASPNMTKEKWYAVYRCIFSDYLSRKVEQSPKNRLKMLLLASNLFKEGLEKNRVRKEDFSKDEWKLFSMIAKLNFDED